jgi:hypothetical protein
MLNSPPIVSTKPRATAKAQAHAVRAGTGAITQSLEGLEDHLALLDGDPRSLVDHPNVDQITSGDRLDPYGRPWW